MSIQLKVYDNGDHTCLVWLPDKAQPIPGCRGFAIRRIHQGKEDYLHGMVGFSDADKFDPKNPWKFPLQRFMWWDYFVKPGDKVQYSIVPVIGPDMNHLALDSKSASPLTPEMTVTGQCTPHISAFFNKGIVAAQWVSRALATQPKDSKIKQIVAQPDNPVRNALSGLLRPEIISLLEETKKNNGKIFAALYELNDPELIPALVAFGKDCNLILANGAFKGNKPPDNDENADVRAQLKPKINVIDRIVSSGHFGHNKFVVFCDSTGKPQRVLTGSTNWTTSGLCTQANNGLIIDDPAVAADFLAAWNRIKDAGDDYTPALVNGNSTANTFPVDGCKVTPWFVKTSAAQDLEYARKLINAAKEGILFLFFNPGTFQQDPMHWTLLQNILERHNQDNKAAYNPDLYFCGVVNQDIPQLTKPGSPKKGAKQPDAALDPTVAAPSPVTLFQSAIEPPQRLTHDVLVPHNIKDQFFNWEKELLGASMVNIHSKVIVLDPFGENPVLMTGSHNLGFKASHANDDNLVIIEGNGPLAAAYAINIVAIFQNYRWNNYVETHRKDPKVWHGLVDNDQWQTGYLSGSHLAELNFWLGGKPMAAAAAAASGAFEAAPARAGLSATSVRHAVRSVSSSPQVGAAPVAHSRRVRARRVVKKKTASSKRSKHKAAKKKKTKKKSRRK
jgi:phosphatidylserine/phosphatidylglycerophosphate/cardiolipin synthase-like enzyme